MFFVIYKVHCPAEIFMAKILWWGLQTTRQNVLIATHTLAGGWFVQEPADAGRLQA